MKTKIFIHIGHSKTGSSSLQRILKDNKDKLRDNGILYPETGLLEAKGIGQHKLAFILNEKFPGWIPTDKQIIDYSIFDDLKDEIVLSGCDRVILSSEVFSSIREKSKVEKLKEVLSDYDVQIVAYVRQPDRWLESWYAQIVKDHPFTNTLFSDFVERHKLHIYRILANYCEVFGVENILVNNYEYILNEYESVIKHFSKIIDYKEIGELEFSNTNVTPSKEVVELLRKMNGLLDIPTDLHRQVNLLVVQELSSHFKNTNEYLTDEERAIVKSKYLTQINNIKSPLFIGREMEFIGE